MTRISAAVAALALPGVLLLGGCSMIPDIGIPGVDPEQTIEDILDGVVPDGVALETGELPASFPSEVPLVDGEVLVAFAVPGDAGESYQVTIRVPDQASADQAGPLLEGAGFTKAPVGYTGHGYLVAVTSQSVGEGVGVGVVYVVTPTE